MGSTLLKWTLRVGLGSVLLLSLPLCPLVAIDFSAVQAAEPLDKNTATEDQLKGFPSKDPIRSSFDFRKTSWGMAKEQVKKAETGKLEAEKDDRLGYSDSVAGKEVAIIYVFTKNKLTRSTYIFTSQHTNKNLFINDYEEIKQLLSDKYGLPSKDGSRWANDLYRNAPQDWGMAVSVGHLSYWSSWDTQTTNIFHGLRGDNYKVTLMTQYKSKELEKLEQQSEKDKTLSNF